MSRLNRHVPQLSRRQVMRLATLGALGASASGWIETLAAATAADPNRRKSCILLWMSGGPSQTDTFDPKPGHANSGPFKPISTAVPGMMLGPHLKQLARQAGDLAIVRSMSTSEGDHGRATYYLRTGYLPQGAIRYPALGALVANEFDDESAELPGFVSISPVRAINAAAFTSGFLGPRCAPLNVGERNLAGGTDPGTSSLRVEDLDVPRGVGRSRSDERLELLQTLGNDFLAVRPGIPSFSHQSAYRRAVKMMRSSAAKAFDLDEEPAALQDAYGRNPFGQGCLLARRLVERGVRFVQVYCGAGSKWDSHSDIEGTHAKTCRAMDQPVAGLLKDLRRRGLLEETLVVWGGEFGRTPMSEKGNGRDHNPYGFTMWMAGGGVKPGIVVGKTDDLGLHAIEDRLHVHDIHATILHALGADHTKLIYRHQGRPERPTVNEGQVFQPLLLA
jgi:uncharacterized protein (DUF1501 family)